jgi:hypothetical protein
MMKAAAKGRITPAMVVSGPDPLIGCVPFERGAVYRSNQNYVHLNITGLFADALKPHTGGKLICPKCNTWANVQSKGPCVDRIRQVGYVRQQLHL